MNELNAIFTYKFAEFTKNENIEVKFSYAFSIDEQWLQITGDSELLEKYKTRLIEFVENNFHDFKYSGGDFYFEINNFNCLAILFRRK